jgi:hypothetical protein
MIKNIVLATQSQIKIDATKEVFKKLGVDLLLTSELEGLISTDEHPTIELRTYSTNTDYTQPIGHNQAKHCIAQRLREAENASDANTTLLLALENFVYQDSEGKFRDSCLVGVRMKSDGFEHFFQEICHTPRREFSVLVPECLYPTLIDAENTGNTLQKTCGQMLREKFGEEIEFSDKDWFKEVANSEFDRKQQIVSELYNCRSLLHTAFYEAK